jgi:glucose-6-phosphate 1-dehydrogenase
MSEDEMTIDSQYLQTCDIPPSESKVRPLTFVILGGAGDLSRRKLVPSLFHLFRDNELPGEFVVIAFDRVDLDDRRYRTTMAGGVELTEGSTFEQTAWDAFSCRLYYVRGYFEDDGSFDELKRRISELAVPNGDAPKDVIYYMSVPPHVVPLAVEKLKFHSLCKGTYEAKIVVEKPFGSDRQSAQQLNRILTDAFDENHIYRIDHYLAKEPVDNIIFFRFSNTIFDEVWNRRYVDNVQITVAEEIGIEHRGAFYEKAGVVRDIVQNHMFQILSLMAMEAPVGITPDFIRDEKVKIIRSIRPIDPEYIDRFVVLGQYGPGDVNGGRVCGYREEPLVAKSSKTPTFFAAKLYIDNLRWAGVPFYLRTGKRLPKRITEICIQFKRLPLRLFGRTCDVLEPNVLVLTIQPDERIALRFLVKYPYSTNQVYSVGMDFNYNEVFKMQPHQPYERLLIDVLNGDLTLFVREDTIEQMWSAVDPINARWEEAIPPADYPNYPAGSWGPQEADRLLEREGRVWLTR